ncbi:29537_t:CDS:2 [Racocetra persica]|uniref:29537_t:CDS:1 n=1 Tax=Racocetra persica TaxID=160502 RepID=A0ACA9PX35_9GLOM|nr:29537_t:CDS:2 [Racocetra persica]
MPFYTHQIFQIRSLEYGEQVINLTETNTISQPITREINPEYNTTSVLFSTHSPWTISSKMHQILKEPNTTYPLTTVYSDVVLITNPNLLPNRIAICPSCKSNLNRNYPPYLSHVPSEIKIVSLEKCRYLSSIFLYCSLGCTPGANLFIEYRTLVSTMNYSQNFYSLSIYSGILGAFLEHSDTTSNPPWLDDSLINAANWLKENNAYLYGYTNSFSTTSSNHLSFPIATHLPDDDTPPV